MHLYQLIVQKINYWHNLLPTKTIRKSHASIEKKRKPLHLLGSYEAVTHARNLAKSPVSTKALLSEHFLYNLRRAYIYKIKNSNNLTCDENVMYYEHLC